MWNSVEWMMHRFVVSLVLLVTINLQFVYGAMFNESQAKLLTKHLTEFYGSPSLRPVVDYNSETVKVSFRVHISKIIDFNERQQRVRLEAWRREEWVDQFLQWNPAKYGGLQKITYDHKLIWKPDIKLIENVDDSFIKVFDGDVIVTSNGSVTWYTPIVVTILCKVHIRYFPFDSQTCSLTFQSWAYDSSNLDLQYLEDDDFNSYGDINQTVFHQNGVWSLKTVTTNTTVVESNGAEYKQLVYSLELHRFSSFYVSNVVLPSVLLAILNCLVFMMPIESGERLTFAISNLLAAILFQQLVGGIMPPLGDDLSLLGIFFVYMIIMDGFAIAMTIAVIRMFHQRGDVDVPGCLLKICFVEADDSRGAWKAASADGAKMSQLKQNAEDWRAVARMMDKYLCAFVSIETTIVMMVLGVLFMVSSED